ncbi:hypothetical protein QBC38DRAFT_249114 [Podospora fimiseda]|uniref:Ubiquitin-like domain-containing protein n=1 Tax=Podospora fimiseda TaxID=252190 RepID=A0AAN7BM72_9PEZI|nr:hypothetical protein QBC38DRAFT_249114 [Podospora fimiseda]
MAAAIYCRTLETQEDALSTLTKNTTDVGLVLSSALESYMQVDSDNHRRLSDLVTEINATSALLAKVWKIIASGIICPATPERPYAYTEEGVNDIRSLDSRAEKIFRNIIFLFQRAAHPGPKPYEPPAHLDPAAVLPSVTSLRSINWDWLNPRFELCKQQLKWIKMRVLVYLEAGHLAMFQFRIKDSRPDGAFDRELGLRAATEKLWNRQVNVARSIAKKLEKEKEQAAKANASTSTSTTASTTSLVSAFEPPLPKVNPAPPSFPPVTTKSDDQSSICSTVVDEQGKSATTTPGSPSKKKRDGPGLMDQDTSSEDKSTTPNRESETKDPSPLPKDTELALLTSGLFSSRLGFLSRIFNSIFRKELNPLNESESLELEAWLVNAGATGNPIKVPFGHQRLKHALKRTLRSKKTEPWNCYLSLTPAQREIIGDVTNFASRFGPYNRACIAFDEIKKEGQGTSYIVFFSLTLGRRPVFLKDAVGRNFTFPFDMVRTWEGMNDMIKQAFQNMNILDRHVEAGHFDLIIDNGSIILPRCWTASIHPGARITMHMWPLDKHPLPPRPIGGGGPFPRRTCGGPLPPGWYPGQPIGMSPKPPIGMTGRPFIDPRTGLPMRPPVGPVAPIIIPVVKKEDKNAIKPEEEQRLTLVDFIGMRKAVQETNKGDQGAFTQWLTKMTNIKDVASNPRLVDEMWSDCFTETSSSSSSDSDFD